MGASLIVFGISYMNEWSVPQIVLILLFVCLFEFSLGPIVWIYMSEIMTDKGTSFGTFINLGFTILMAIITPYLVSAALFFTFGGCVTIVFLIFNL